MKVVVTGASGLTAGVIVQELCARGDQVHALVRRHASVPGATEVTVGDCRDAGTMTTLLTRADALIHVAGIRYGQEVSEIAALQNPTSVIVISSAGVYSSHRASAATYRAGENVIKRVRPDAIFLRPTMIYGSIRDLNIHHLILAIHRWKVLPLVGKGDGHIQPIHFKDLAMATAALLAATGPLTLDAGGEAPVTLRHAAETIFNSLRLRPRFVQVPYGLAIAGAATVDSVLSTRWRERVERMFEERTVDNHRLIEVTKVRPRPFSTGVVEEIESLGLAPAK